MAPQEKVSAKVPSWRLPAYGYPEDSRVGIWLTIRPPGTWFDRPKYVVFVGGGGVGEADSLEEAITLVQQQAIRRLKYKKQELLAEVNHIDRQLDKIKLLGWEAFEAKRAPAI